MRVALIIDTWYPFVGGGQINAWEISKRIARKGIKVDIITRNCGEDNLPKVRNLTVHKLGKKTNPKNSISKLLFIFQSFFFVSPKNYDLVHAHAFLPGISVKLLMIFRKIPAIFTVHGTSLKNKLNGPISTLIEKLILTQINYSAQITVSRDFAIIPNINKNIIFIPNGVDAHQFMGSNKMRRVKNNMLCVARLHPQKNLVNLLKAVKILVDEFPNLNLLIAGDGSQKEELKSLVKKLSITKNVNFLGLLERKTLKNLYASSQLLILPSIYEGQSLAILEAFACKLPVVASNTGDTPYMIKDSKNGFLINNPNDPDEIALVTRKALLSKNLAQITESAYNLAKNNYTWDIAAEKTLKLYEQSIKA